MHVLGTPKQVQTFARSWKSVDPISVGIRFEQMLLEYYQIGFRSDGCLHYNNDKIFLQNLLEKGKVNDTCVDYIKQIAQSQNHQIIIVTCFTGIDSHDSITTWLNLKGISYFKLVMGVPMTDLLISNDVIDSSVHVDIDKETGIYSKILNNTPSDEKKCNGTAENASVFSVQYQKVSNTFITSVVVALAAGVLIGHLSAVVKTK